MKLKTVIESKTTKEYIINLIKLMRDYEGSENVTSLIEESTGEILLWKHKHEYCRNNAVVPLMFDGQLTPTNEKVKASLYDRALSNRTIVFQYRDYDEYYILMPYSADIRGNPITVGYTMRLTRNMQKI